MSATLALVPSSVHDPSASSIYTIGELAKVCNLTVRTLRYYEELGLIEAVSRSDGGYRLYDAHTQKRISAITALQHLGYSLESVLTLLGNASENRERLNASGKQAVVSHSKALLEAQYAGLSQKLDDLQALHAQVLQRLETLNDLCTPCSETSPSQHTCATCAHGGVHQF
jgi:DNA-binding transcriptional MerR regulator